MHRQRMVILNEFKKKSPIVMTPFRTCDRSKCCVNSRRFRTFQKMCVFVIAHWLYLSLELLDACVRDRTLVISGFRTLFFKKICVCVYAIAHWSYMGLELFKRCVCTRSHTGYTKFRTFLKIRVSAIAHWLYMGLVLFKRCVYAIAH